LCVGAGAPAGAWVPWTTSALAAAWCAWADVDALFVAAATAPCIGHGCKTPGSPMTSGNQTARETASARNHDVRRITQ